MLRSSVQTGFSLVEMLVGVAILGLLAGVSGAAYQKAMGKASLVAEVGAGKSLTQAYLSLPRKTAVAILRPTTKPPEISPSSMLRAGPFPCPR